jgi:hypothetical protein
MAISNYLYHSQDPTPEDWVIRDENGYCDPCIIDHEFLRFLIPDNQTTGNDESGTKILTRHQVDKLEVLCHELMHNPETGTPYKHFYEGLQTLPFYDGLRLATIVLLVEGGHAGGDLLRMSNNVVRLNEWQRCKPADSSASNANTILSLKMNPDWSGENYEGTLDRVTEFILDDLKVWEEEEEDTATVDEKVRRAKEDFVDMVRNESVLKRKELNNLGSNHFTKNRLQTPDERLELVVKLQADVLFGPILSNLRTIVDSAF